LSIFNKFNRNSSTYFSINSAEIRQHIYLIFGKTNLDGHFIVKRIKLGTEAAALPSSEGLQCDVMTADPGAA
jgi:hypothetical protein